MSRRTPARSLRGSGTSRRRAFMATLSLEILEARRPLHAGHEHIDNPLTSPGFTDPIPGDEVLPWGAEPLNSLSSIPALNSLPGAAVSVYLDFDGHYEAIWGSHGGVTTPVYSRDSDFGTFSDSELQAITDIWAQVSEDFAPFQVNVTTVEPLSFGNGEAMRVSIGGDGAWTGGTWGGIAYVNNFTSSIVNTVYVFSANLSNGNPKRVAEASSHETGHAFGLEHQSLYNASGVKTAEYYSGANGKAPIMGNSYSATRGLWWNGTSSDGPTVIQDDMSVISRNHNGFGYRPDDHGDTPGTASQLSGAGGVLSGSGIIATTADLDYFAFETDAGEVTLNVTLPVHNNLDSRLELRTADDVLVAFAAPSNSFAATLVANVQAGSYRIVVRSQGNYGDVGQYTLTANVLAPSVEGVVFYDTDRDGQRDAGEAGVPDVTIFDDRNRNGVWEAQPQIVLTATDTPLVVPAVGTKRSTLVIDGMPGSIVDLNVRATIQHPNIGNLLILLIDPNGVTTTLAADLPGGGQSLVNAVFDDEAATSIYDATAPYTGNFRPLGSLAPLKGMNPNGSWKLLVSDLTSSDPGVIEDFALEITSSVAEPKTTTDAEGRYLFAFSSTGLHELRQVPLPDYVVTAPAGGVHEVLADIGTTYTNLDFANALPGVIDRALFYDGSTFDDQTAGVNATDDLAIAADKSAYLAGDGPATFANISSYSRGLNGVMIDVLGLSGPLSLSDFQFRTGTDSDPGSWQSAPAPIAITVRAGAGVAGSDRVELVWGNDAVRNAWLEVTLEGNDAAGGFNTATGLPASDVFYFGSRVGDTGSGSAAAAITSASDEVDVRLNAAFGVPITNLYDFDRNGIVSAGDQIIARLNGGFLTKIDLPGPGGAPLAASAVASALAIRLDETSESPRDVASVAVRALLETHGGLADLAISRETSAALPSLALSSTMDFDLEEELLESLLSAIV